MNNDVLMNMFYIPAARLCIRARRLSVRTLCLYRLAARMKKMEHAICSLKRHIAFGVLDILITFVKYYSAM